MKINHLRIAFLSFILLLVFANHASAQETKLKCFGHAAFSITTPNGKVLLVDPWLINLNFYEMKPGETLSFRGGQMVKNHG